MASITFYHPRVSPDTLVISTGMDEIGWNYNLNTQAFPTYGGEVIQILSCNLDQLVISGTLPSYTTGDFTNPGLEEVTKWFVDYMQAASQGHKGHSGQVEAFTSIPISCTYPARGWTIEFVCESLPDFWEGVDVVAPTFQITGKITSYPERLAALTLTNLLATNTADAKAFDAIQSGVDLKQPNPAINPYESPFDTAKKKVQKQILARDEKYLGSYYGTLVKGWSEGDVSDLTNPTATESGYGKESTTPSTKASSSNKRSHG